MTGRETTIRVGEEADGDPMITPERERFRTRETAETEVIENDNGTTTKLHHYEEEIRELHCEHCNDWHHEDEMVPVGIDMEPGENPEAADMMCQYHAQAFFGYEPDAETPVYQPIVDELDHWTWREILAATGPPIAGAVAIVALVTVLTPTLTAVGEALATVTETLVLGPARTIATGAGANGEAGPFDGPVMLAIAMATLYWTMKFID